MIQAEPSAGDAVAVRTTTASIDIGRGTAARSSWVGSIAAVRADGGVTVAGPGGDRLELPAGGCERPRPMS